MARARITIDLAAMARNFAQVRADTPGCEVAPVVKADGYGLGLAPVITRLWDEGARSFFVARFSEGEEARAALGGHRPATVYVLDGVSAEDAPQMSELDLTPVLNGLDQLAAWNDLGGGRRPAALHLDTGMNRIGLSWLQASAAARAVSAARHVELTHVMSHLARAADPSEPKNRLQLERFREARRLFAAVPASMAASAGIYLSPDYHFDLIRPGITLFGGGPRDRTDPRFDTVVTVEAPVLQVRDLAAGDTVGYGTMFTAAKAMRVALIAIGYADGLLRGSHNSGKAVLGGRQAPFVALSMDLAAIDVSDIGPVQPGDVVELLGPNLRLDDVAISARTVPHECLTRLSTRAERRYVG